MTTEISKTNQTGLELSTTTQRKEFFKTYIHDFVGDKPNALQELRFAQLYQFSKGLNVSRAKGSISRRPLVSLDEIMQWYEDQGFITTILSNVLLTFKFTPEQEAPTVICLHYDDGDFFISASRQDSSELIKVISEKWPSTHKVFTYAFPSDRVSGGLKTGARLISLKNKAKDSFYPFLPKEMSQYLADFMASSAPVLLLIGPPGTGKTSLIRNYIIENDLKTVTCHDQNVMASPDLFSTAINNDYKLLVMEDADEFISKRRDGNKHMASLLNETQGFSDSNGLKFIISTNLDNISSIDEALIRPGRCFGIVNFRNMNEEEAKAVWKDMDMQPHELSPNRDNWSLSEVLNPLQYSDSTYAPKVRKVGFV